MKFVYSQRGVTLIELLVASVITVVSILGVSIMLQNTMKTSQDTQSSSWVNQLRSEILKSLKHPQGWENTVRNIANTDIACLRAKYENPGSTTVNCPASGGQLNVIMDLNNPSDSSTPAPRPIIDMSNDRGFDKRGQVCERYSQNENCIYRYVITWRPRCQGDSCLNPDYVIQGRLLFKQTQGQNTIFNPEYYAFTTYVSNPESPAAACQLTGLGNMSGGNCVIQPSSTQCSNPGEYLVGFNANGSPRCAPRNLPSCSTGYLYGVNNSGGALCDPRACL